MNFFETTTINDLLNVEHKIDTIVIATKNEGKIREIGDMLNDLNIEIKSLSDFPNIPDAIEDGDTFIDNARIKATFYSKYLNLPCVADDSGLAVEYLNNEPGVYSARWSGDHNQQANNAKLVNELKKKNLNESPAVYHCALVFHDTNGNEIVTTGKLCGIVKTVCSGKYGFSYDPYFWIDDHTVADLTTEEKNKISHRGIARKNMHDMLKRYIGDYNNGYGDEE